MCLNQINFARFRRDEKELLLEEFRIYSVKLGHKMTRNIFDFHKNLTCSFSSQFFPFSFENRTHSENKQNTLTVY